MDGTHFVQVFQEIDITPTSTADKHRHSIRMSFKLGCTWTGGVNSRQCYSQVCVFFVTEIPAMTKENTFRHQDAATGGKKGTNTTTGCPRSLIQFPFYKLAEPLAW